MELINEEEVDSASSEILCRICNKTCVSFFPVISRICQFSTTIKDMIVLLVPKMETILEDNDVICSVCRQILIHCLQFIDKCLHVECNSKGKLVVEKPNEDIPSIIKKDKEHLDSIVTTQFDEQDSPGFRLNGHYESGKDSNDAEDNDISPVRRTGILSNYFPNYNRLISARNFPTKEMDTFICTLESSEIKTFNYFQDLGTSERKRVILLGSTFKCNKCGKYLIAKSQYENHLQVHEKRLLKQEKVQKRVRNKFPKGESRQRMKVRQKIFKCRTCSEKFSSKEDMQFHIKIHPPYVCEKCGKGFAKSNLMYVHRSVHNSPNSYICEICGKSYKCRSQLRKHQLIHNSESHFCNKCPKKFGTSYSLKAHLKFTHNEGITKTWTCKVCGRIFKRRNVFQSHYRQIHLRDGPFKCDICGQGFGRSDYLKRHKQRHIMNVVNGPYQCQICKKIFKRLVNLKLHIRTHGRFFRFNCKYCSSTFKNKYQRNRHEKLHEDSELLIKYRCKICWKRMKSQEDLELHSLNHNQFRYKCDICGECFASKHVLANHVVNDHVESQEELQILLSTGLGPLSE